MTKVRLSVAIDEEIADAIREIAGADGTSSFINIELTTAVWRRRSRSFMADLDEKLGPVGPEAERWADAQLALAMGSQSAD